MLSHLQRTGGNVMRPRPSWVLVLTLAHACGVAAAETPGYVWQGLPDHAVAGVERRDRFFEARLPRRGREGDEFVFERDKTWGPGAKVTVAFNGGSPELRDQIAGVAKTWSEHAKIELDFRSETGHRTWSPRDEAYAAQIRIGFADRGHWSMVGTDSSDPLVAGPGDPSMNFQGFAVELPHDWSAVVLHEFGHALGFHHEHQNPSGGCQDQFRWHDDPGYVPTRDIWGQFVADRKRRRPGLYTQLGGPPNNWPKSKVDSNLGRLANEEAYTTSTFDATSIMKYFFAADMFVDGDRSRCFSARNLELSHLDKQGAAAAYPSDPQLVAALVRTRSASLNALLAVPDLSDAQRRHYEALLANLTAR
jgi:hypothetical protein